MAIVKMQKISFYGLASQREAALSYLMKKGVMQIDDAAALAEEEEISSIVSKDARKDQARKYERRKNAAFSAMTGLKQLTGFKKGLFAQKHERAKPSYDEARGIYQKAKKVNADFHELDNLKARQTSLENEIQALTPWRGFDGDLGTAQTKTVRMLLGTLPKTVTQETVLEALAEQAPYAVYVEAGRDEVAAYGVLYAHKSCFDEAVKAARAVGFSPAGFQDLSGTSAENIARCEKEIENLEKQQETLRRALVEKKDLIADFERIFDYYAMLQEQQEVTERLLVTRKTFYAQGYVPKDRAVDLKEGLEARFYCRVELSDVEAGEAFPIAFHNPAPVRPFEVVTEQFSMPGPKDVDPNFLMSIFYFVFFGMMLSDAVYGLLLIAACTFIHFKYKPEGTMGKIVSLIGICGISTFFWGALYGSWMGDLFGIKGVLDPLSNVMFLLILSFILGAVHLFVGMGVKAYMLIKGGDILGAVFDVGFWWLLLVGIVLVLFGGNIGVTGPVPMYLAIAGAAGILLTAGRKKKKVLGKITGGLSELYNITSYVSDVLSYSRLLALGLSTGVIANVVNLMAGLCWPGLNVLVILFGHTLNIAINTLGAYVHTCRLQYVEFFSKFYEGGGKAFKPFQRNTKYVNFKES